MTDELLTVGRIAELVGGTVDGDASGRIHSIASLESAGADEVTFAADNQRLARLADCKAGAAIVAKSAGAASATMPLIRVENVQVAVATLLGHLKTDDDRPPVGIAETAIVAADAQLDKDVRIGPGAVIGSGAKIGRSSTLCANVVIGQNVELGQDVLLCEGVVIRRDSAVGDRVVIGPNSVIGYDGFGYYFADGQHRKIPHIGNVVIEDDVEIGACSCVDRAKFGSTRIGAGTKIDNLVQVAHNVQIGRGCLLAALCGIAGSSKLGEQVVLGGSVGIRDNIALGDGVTCGAFSAVYGNVPDGQTLLGIPAVEAKQKIRQILLTAKLPKFVERIRELEKRLSALESSEDH